MTKLLIRMSPDGSLKPGMELAHETIGTWQHPEHGEFNEITGVTAGEMGSGGRKLRFIVPADVPVLGLYLSRKGWLLREEDADSRNPLGRAWLHGKIPPDNEIKFSDA